MNDPNEKVLIQEALSQSRSNAAQLTDMRDTVNNLAKQVSRIAEIFEAKISDIRKDSRPNFGTWAAWAGVIVMFLSPVFYGLHEEINSRAAFNKERMEWVDRLGDERAADNRRRLDRIEDERLYERLDSRDLPVRRGDNSQ